MQKPYSVIKFGNSYVVITNGSICDTYDNSNDAWLDAIRRNSKAGYYRQKLVMELDGDCSSDDGGDDGDE